MSTSYDISRTQGLVIGFFVVAWVAIVVMLLASSAVRGVMLDRLSAHGTAPLVGFAVGLLAFLTLLTVGVLRRWRWIFWLLLVTFAFGVLRIPVAILQLGGGMAPEGPSWYVVTQGLIGIVQGGIAVAMWVGYRRGGIWG